MLLLDKQKVVFITFPNGETALDLNRLSFGPSSQVTLKYESDRDLISLLILKRYMDSVLRIANNVSLVISYMPYSRMDRENDHYAFSLKYVCDFINSLNFAWIQVVDPHSDVTPALLNNARETSYISNLFQGVLEDYRTDNKVIMYPDAGAQKRYGKLFQYPSVVGFKERDFQTGAICKFSVFGADVKDKTVVIVDDLCSKGGTFMGAAQELRNLGACKVILVVAHCENTIFDGDIFTTDLISMVYTTDSLLSDSVSHPKLKVAKIYEVKQ